VARYLITRHSNQGQTIMLTKDQVMQKLLYTQEQIETALDKGQLWIAMTNGNYWQCRRGGRTKTWVNKPGHFRLSVKYGLKNWSAITHDDLKYVSGHYLISETKPERYK
jgi:hypothetical protein